MPSCCQQRKRARAPHVRALPNFASGHVQVYLRVVGVALHILSICNAMPAKVKAKRNPKPAACMQPTNEALDSFFHFGLQQKSLGHQALHVGSGKPTTSTGNCNWDASSVIRSL